jgi:hypothetical protein
MKRTRHTPEQIIRKLKTAEQLIAQGKSVADVCRALEVSQPQGLLEVTPMAVPSQVPSTPATSEAV